MICTSLTASWADCHSRQRRGGGGGRGGGCQNVTISQKVVMKKTSGIVRPALPHLAPPPSIRLQQRPSASAPRAPPQSPNPPPQHPPKSHPHHPSIFIPLLLRLIDFPFSPLPLSPPPSSIFSSTFPAAQHVSLRSPSLPRTGQSFSSLTRSEPWPRAELLKLRKWRRNVIEAGR